MERQNYQKTSRLSPVFMTYIPGVGFVFSQSGFSLDFGGIGGGGFAECFIDAGCPQTGFLTLSGQLNGLLSQLPGQNPCNRGPVISENCNPGAQFQAGPVVGAGAAEAACLFLEPCGALEVGVIILGTTFYLSSPKEKTDVNCDELRQKALETCSDKFVGRGHGSDAPALVRKCIRQILEPAGCSY